jgi:L-threonylcarbamoyladenylate synthase
MEVKKIDRLFPDPNTLRVAAEVLCSGGLLVYPTDTAYGLGVNAFDLNAIKKMYKVKKRSFSKPTHVVVRDWKMVRKIAYTSAAAKKIYLSFFPGPLSLLLNKKRSIPDVLTAGLPAVGVRIPNSLVTQQLSRLVTFPYTTPSANRSGEREPYSKDEVVKVLDTKHVDLVLDAGELPKARPSTIAGVSGNKITIIREGPISKKRLEECLV